MMNKRKTKRFQEGGMSDEDVKSFAGTPDNDSNAGMAMEAGMMEKEPDENFKSTPKAKAPMVTKEQLAKSGLSLRDYMNKQQGLTRRGESKTDTADKDRIASIIRPSPKDAKERIAKEALSSIQSSGRKYPDMSALQAPAKPAGMTAMARRKIDQNEDTSYKSGGSVSSASKRADGIATKGKTRGKLY